jgi:3-oxoacyl-[acyl-carrier protein] reductase
MINLKNKIVLITGGSSGIGKACVKLFSQAGAEVAFTFNKRENEAKKLVSEFSDIVKIKSYRIDISSQYKILAIVDKVIKDFGRIDILVNNAGIWKFGEADKMSLSDWNEMIKINLNSTFIFTKGVIPSMKKNKFGRIINITSTAGQRGEAFHSHYAASKGGVISFTKSLAVEVGKFNITVNSVAPGWVETELTEETFANKKFKEKVKNDIPLRRIAMPEDIAGPVLFLSSDLARHINGEILNVNGGSVLCG